MNTIKLLTIAAIALVGCGDNKSAPDARQKDAKPPIDGNPFPAAPQLGMQVDRVGRPTINTALNHGFDPTAAAQTEKKAYNEDSTIASWLTPARIGEFAKNLAMIDVLDTGKCGNGICEGLATVPETGANVGNTCPADCTANQTGASTANGCGNQALYNGGQTGLPANAMSYVALAGLLANDQLFLDTGKSICTFYLGVEFGVVTGSSSTCGGRAPQYDVIDFSLSMIAMGLSGFSVDGLFTPKIQDLVPAHADVSAANFPFLGAPH